MRRPGQIVLFPFPHTDQTKAKLRPALLIGKVPGEYDDWLICMISSQLHHEVSGFDEVIGESDQVAEFTQDDEGHYTGFVIKTFAPSGEAAPETTVHYSVDAKSTPH